MGSSDFEVAKRQDVPGLRGEAEPLRLDMFLVVLRRQRGGKMVTSSWLLLYVW